MKVQGPDLDSISESALSPVFAAVTALLATGSVGLQHKKHQAHVIAKGLSKPLRKSQVNCQHDVVYKPPELCK